MVVLARPSICENDPARRELQIYANALISSLAAFAVAGTFLSQHYNEMLWHFIALSTALSVMTFESEPAKPVIVPNRLPLGGCRRHESGLETHITSIRGSSRVETRPQLSLVPATSRDERLSTSEG